MSDDVRRERLAEDGLPPPEILDAWEVPEPSPDAIDRLFTGLSPEPIPERKPMHPATSSPRRSLLASVAVGFLVAAGLLLSFWFGRQSVEPRVVEVPIVQPAAPEQLAVAGGCPEPPPAVDCPTAEPILMPIPVPVPETEPEPQRAPRASRERPTPPSAASRDLKNPFAAKTATLHIGTNKGVGPAKVFVDGVYRGKTPLANVKVTPGRHLVEWRFGDGKVIEWRVDVEDGGSEVLKAG